MPRTAPISRISLRRSLTEIQLLPFIKLMRMIFGKIVQVGVIVVG